MKMPLTSVTFAEGNLAEVLTSEEKQINDGCSKYLDEAASIENGSNIWTFLKRNAFVMLTLAGVVIGIGLGFILRHINISERGISYVYFPGELMLRMLQMMILPLVISSLIAGMSSVDRKGFGKIGLCGFIYFFVSTITAAFTGISVTLLIQPGKSAQHASESSAYKTEAVQGVDFFLDLIRNLIPSNLVEACFRKYVTVYSKSNSSGNRVPVINMTANTPMQGTTEGINTVGLLVFSVAFGFILSSMETEGKPLRDFFNCLNMAIMRLINIVIWYSPVGIIFLLAGQVVKMANTVDVGRDVAMFTLTVITGLIIHGCFTLPLIYFAVTRRNPFRFYGGILHALSMAFGTSSSSATLPVSLYCMEENHKVDKQVTRFMLPLGATMNMDGTALYEAVAALFIAQLNDIDFNLGQIIVLSLVVTAISTGAAGVPSTGLTSMLIVLGSVGLPTEDISLLLMVNWILDRVCTVTNVLGDCIGVGVVQHLSRHELQADSPTSKNLMLEDNQLISNHPFKNNSTIV